MNHSIINHPNPLARLDSTDLFYIQNKDGEIEQLWGKRIEGNQYLVTCIPILNTGLAWRDIVEVTSYQDKLLFEKVINPSGNFSQCVIFMLDAPYVLITKKLEAMDITIEMIRYDTYALNISASRKGEALTLLEEFAKQGFLKSRESN
jgi:hypothetical protein